MQLLKTLTAASYQDLIDYNVVDANGDHVGTLHSLWSDQDTGEIEFLGVKTGWLFGRNHVVPASEAQIDADEKFVKIPYRAEFIKNAPSIDADSEINEDQERDIFRYYSASARPTTGVGAAAPATGAGAGAMADTALADTGTGSGLGNATTGGAAAPASSDMARALGATAAGGSTSGVGAVGASAGATSGRLRRTGTGAGVSVASPSGGSGSTGAAAGGGVLPSATNAGGALGLDTSHPDPLTGEPGAHPVGTGIGAASGAATGAAMGAAGGPVGAVIGGIAGAVVGGLIGKGVEEYFDPTEEAAYWKSNHSAAAYYDPTRSFEEYEPAYRTGYEGFGRFAREGRTGGDFSTVETDLQQDYERRAGATGVSWEQAKHAAREAYERVRANARNRPPGES